MPGIRNVTVLIYDIPGHSVRHLTARILEAGIHKINREGCDDYDRTLTSGIYLYLVNTGTFTESKKILLLIFFTCLTFFKEIVLNCKRKRFINRLLIIN